MNYRLAREVFVKRFEESWNVRPRYILMPSAILFLIVMQIEWRLSSFAAELRRLDFSHSVKHLPGAIVEFVAMVAKLPLLYRE